MGLLLFRAKSYNWVGFRRAQRWQQRGEKTDDGEH